MNPKERELLTGMGNCFEACGADYRGTLDMVAGARRLAPAEVESMLARLKASEGETAEYRTLRGRLPASFPL